jgi:predicted DNA-binding protein (UPF0251 family)/DNA-directed RNA polymerase subunit RPC12/RpoP
MHQPPILRGFKPFGAPPALMDAINLLLEEYESLRLADYDNLTQEEAAKKMNVSRPTFTRIYDRARKKIAMAFVENRSILIEGGNIEFNDEWYRCLDCNSLFKSPASDERFTSCPTCSSSNIVHINKQIKESTEKDTFKTGFSPGSAFCVCPDCGFKITHKKGIPCRQMTCHNCGSKMKREL